MMMDSIVLLDLCVRLTVILLAGWLALMWLGSKHNPRWSVAVSRCMIAACFGIPLIYSALPGMPVSMIGWPRSTATLSPTPAGTEPANSASDRADAPAFAPHPRATRVPAGEQQGGVVSAPPPSLQTDHEPHTAVIETAASQHAAGSEPALRAASSHSGRPQRLTQSSETATALPERALRPTERGSQLRADQRSLGRWFIVVWPVVSVLLLVRVGSQYVRTRALLRGSWSASEAWIDQCRAIVEGLALRTTPEVRIASGIQGPCTAGLLRPVVLLPAAWQQELSIQQGRPVLAHEFSHIAGRDGVWDLLARLATAVWWFHPLVWQLTLRHRLACEFVCDAVAAEMTSDFDSYRRLLAGWALRRQEPLAATATLAMADRSLLLRRLNWLERCLPAARLARYRYASFLAAVVTAIALTASMRFVAVVVASPQESASTDPPAAGTPAAPTQATRRPNVADIDTSRTEPKVVRVVDTNEQPIAGARVHVGWWEDEDGDMLGVATTDRPVTDAAGEVILAVPLGAAWAQISADAEGYASAGTQYSLSGSPKLKLEQGRVVQVDAVDEDGNPLADAYPLLQQSRTFGREFKQDPNRPGHFASPVVKLERRWMRVVDGSGDGPLRFSDLIDVTQPGEAQPDGTIVAVLRPGIRLQGRLDASVPRPITAGCVELYINEGEGHRIQRGEGWTWEDTAIVNEDGSFVFESLPRGGHVQLVALVDGFQSTKPTPEALRAYLEAHDAGEVALVDQAVERSDAFWPHLFSLGSDQLSVDVELPCIPTASLDVLVVNPLGRPIEGASVHFNPNGYFLGGELFIPATQGFTSGALLRRHSQAPRQQLYQWAGESFLRPKTDQAGVARVRNLPAGERESYRVEAEGYVMPVHPTSTPSTPDSAMRYATAELVGGQTIRRTVTMEQFVPRQARDVPVVNRNAKPMEKITVTITEIAFADAPEDWVLWAVQRFGAIATAETGADGIARLQVPTQVDGRSVDKLRVSVNGRVGSDGSVREILEIPAEADQRVVVLIPAEEAPARNHFRTVNAQYIDPATLLDDSPAEVLTRLVETPSMTLLNLLLKQAQYAAATPLRFRADRNLLLLNQSARTPVASVSTDQGQRIVVLCDVRPKDALWDVAPEGAFPPEAAFVFAADGELIDVIGGWASGRGDYNSVMLTNLGGTDDTFVETSAFEHHGPFEYLQRWYRLGQESQPALTVYGYANATSWSGRDGAAQPLAEFGYVEFRFNGKNLAHDHTGIVASGAAAPRKLYWDGRQNRFLGPPNQSLEGKPLYQVMVEQSAAFEPLDVQKGELVIGGGRRDYENWHYWDVVVPQGKMARLTLVVEGQDDAPAASRELASSTLQSGWHPLQLQIRDSQDDKASSMVSIRTEPESSDAPAHRIPRVSIADVPSVEHAPVARTAASEVILLRRTTVQDGVWLVWKLALE